MLNTLPVTKYKHLLPVLVVYAQRLAQTTEDWMECAKGWKRLNETEFAWVCAKEALSLLKSENDQEIAAEFLESEGGTNSLSYIKRKYPI